MSEQTITFTFAQCGIFIAVLTERGGDWNRDLGNQTSNGNISEPINTSSVTASLNTSMFAGFIFVAVGIAFHKPTSPAQHESSFPFYLYSENVWLGTRDEKEHFYKCLQIAGNLIMKFINQSIRGH